ncbi:class II aldolase/adducin family protein [bacterium]|nr:class II aldolase/adducin family protein [candidate division CSSED10-310 bacterium]
MDRLMVKYAEKLVSVGLVEPGEAVMGVLDADLEWNRDDPRQDVLNRIFQELSINSLICALPAEPYRTMITSLAESGDDAIYPKDCETRTFIHDLPLSRSWDAATIVAALKRRKSVIIPDKGIITFGIVSPEQAFIVFSSVCFAVFVTFFSDYLTAARHGHLTAAQRKAFQHVLQTIPAHIDLPSPNLTPGPFCTESSVMAAMIEAGGKTVEYELVDSFFGNISYRAGDTIYISQTSSSLDELGGCIDPCPVDGSSCAGVTASSELAAHREVLTQTPARAILHGHPKFSVILSMDCTEDTDCENRNECYRRCPKKRFVNGVPIVPGEVGTGPFGLCRTMPAALRNHPGVIVYGHGVFATGRQDFREAFDTLMTIETECRKTFFERVRQYDRPVT